MGLEQFCHNPYRTRIEVDYSTRSKTIYQRLHAKCFGLLLQEIDDLPKTLSPTDIKDERLPSWCPAWCSGRNICYLPSTGTGAGRPPPGDGEVTKRPLKVELSDDCQRQKLKGASSDVIDVVLPLEYTDDSTIAELKDIKTLLAKITKSENVISECQEQNFRCPGVLVGDHKWRNRATFSAYPFKDILKVLQAYLTRIIATQPVSDSEEVVNIDEQGAWQGDDRFARAYWNLVVFRWQAEALPERYTAV